MQQKLRSVLCGVGFGCTFFSYAIHDHKQQIDKNPLISHHFRAASFELYKDFDCKEARIVVNATSQPIIGTRFEVKPRGALAFDSQIAVLNFTFKNKGAPGWELPLDTSDIIYITAKTAKTFFRKKITGCHVLFIKKLKEGYQVIECKELLLN